MHKTTPNHTSSITRYSQQYSQVYDILERHWHLLTEDPIEVKYVGNKPGITYINAKCLKDHLTRSHFVGVSELLSHCTGRWGTYKCNSCIFLFNAVSL